MHLFLLVYDTKCLIHTHWIVICAFNPNVEIKSTELGHILITTCLTLYCVGCGGTDPKNSSL